MYRDCKTKWKNAYVYKNQTEKMCIEAVKRTISLLSM